MWYCTPIGRSVLRRLCDATRRISSCHICNLHLDARVCGILEMKSWNSLLLSNPQASRLTQHLSVLSVVELGEFAAWILGGGHFAPNLGSRLEDRETVKSRSHVRVGSTVTFSFAWRIWGCTCAGKVLGTPDCRYGRKDTPGSLEALGHIKIQYVADFVRVCSLAARAWCCRAVQSILKLSSLLDRGTLSPFLERQRRLSPLSFSSSLSGKKA